jgi:hypothetical protein
MTTECVARKAAKTTGVILRSPSEARASRKMATSALS